MKENSLDAEIRLAATDPLYEPRGDADPGRRR